MAEDSEHMKGLARAHEEAAEVSRGPLARETHLRESLQETPDFPGSEREPASAPGEPGSVGDGREGLQDPREPAEGLPAPPGGALGCPCGSLTVYARGVCRTCHRKLGQAGLPIGADGRGPANAAKALQQAAMRLSGASPERMEALARRMLPDARERMAEALRKARGA